MNSRDIRELARGLGFELAGVAPALPSGEPERYRRWADDGFAGEMRYLTDRRAELRNDPRSLLASAPPAGAKASAPASPSPSSPKPRSAKDIEVIEQARALGAGEGFKGDVFMVDDAAKVNHAERGWWVEAWVFIEDPLTPAILINPSAWGLHP